jgi:hypothetical protein
VQDELCPICVREVETVEHVLWECAVAQDVWSSSSKKLLLHKFNCTRQLHKSLSSVAGVQVRGRIPQRIGFVKN